MAFCTDIGAPRSVVGVKEMNRIFGALKSRAPTLNPSRNRFRFADAVYNSLGQIKLPLLTPPGQPTIDVILYVVTADIPSLLGMDLLDKESLTPCTVMNRLVKRLPDKNSKDGYIDQWHVPLTHEISGHLYADIDCSVPMYITRLQLQRLNRQFAHPSATKLFNLLSRARPKDATPETRRILEDIGKMCHSCQRIQSDPKRFRVTMGSEHIQFNERVLMDIMYLDSKPVLHIIDEGTHLNAAGGI